MNQIRIFSFITYVFDWEDGKLERRKMINRSSISV